ncbi:MAG: glycerol-3-phosphate dehydrogenase/oxidase [Acidimicrobiales bacterium]|nr:glycerol-3-phosphate dehydrogenase/oxidase [Acidimicrobiales bacterium]
MNAPTSTSVPGSLGPRQRRRDLDRLADEEFDVLVIGGGITGVGCALDAATRGLSVALVEQRDIASGTSSRSSKLLHGGLRYLEQRDFALVREALHERGLLTRTVCPHLVRPVRFLIPLNHRVWQRLYYGAGVLLYDLLAWTGKNPLPRHRHLSRTSALELVPGLKQSTLIGGIVYSDAQIDDARHTLAVARTAARHGAAVATSTQVTGLVFEDDTAPPEDRVVVGAEVRDLEGDRTIVCRAKKVVNATGVWIDDIQDMAGPTGLTVRAAKGVHIVVPRDRIESHSGVVLRTPRSVLFIIPWGVHWLIGTTDTDWSHDRAHPAASQADIDYILEHANAALARPLTEDDIVGVYAGLRPLVSGAEDEDTAKLSREHAVAEPVRGLISIAGGKYTTYRVMAADTIDTVVEGLDRPVPASCTDEVTVLGSEHWDEWSDEAPDLAARHGLPVDLVERLLWRHGTRINDVFDLFDEDDALREVISGLYVAAEIVHACRHEGALHLEDVLARRLRISIEVEERGTAIAHEAAALMARELGWDDRRTAAEIRAWQRRVDAELAANDAPDDSAADTIRRQVVDARGLVDDDEDT